MGLVLGRFGGCGCLGQGVGKLIRRDKAEKAERKKVDKKAAKLEANAEKVRTAKQKTKEMRKKNLQKYLRRRHVSKAEEAAEGEEVAQVKKEDAAEAAGGAEVNEVKEKKKTPGTKAEVVP